VPHSKKPDSRPFSGFFAILRARREEVVHFLRPTPMQLLRFLDALRRSTTWLAARTARNIVVDAATSD